MIKNIVASRLLPNDLNFREQVIQRIRAMMEDVDMAIHGRGQGLGFVYSNLGDFIKKVNPVGATAKDMSLLYQSRAEEKKQSRDSMDQLKSNVARLQEMQSRLEFMLKELEGVVKKG